MLLQVVSVYDSAAQCYSQPSFVPTVGTAVRSFQDIMKDSNSQCAKHPEDFVLYHIGVFNDELGYLEPLIDDSESGTPVFKPRMLARAIDYVSPVQPKVGVES